MVIYLAVNPTTHIITGYSLEPLPRNSIEYAMDNPESIKIGIDTFENNQVVSQPIPEEILRIRRIDFLKKCLNDTDYMAIKHADGALTDEEYEVMRLQRQAWRDEINELEQGE